MSGLFGLYLYCLTISNFKTGLLPLCLGKIQFDTRGTLCGYGDLPGAVGMESEPPEVEYYITMRLCGW